MSDSKAKHTAWRYFNGKQIGYVESFDWSPFRKGDPYSYTNDHAKALQMTESQCRKFCKYMSDCGTIGFWS
jgi:hypothetical protein